MLTVKTTLCSGDMQTSWSGFLSEIFIFQFKYHNNLLHNFLLLFYVKALDIVIDNTLHLFLI